jgi:hypothetical protein
MAAMQTLDPLSKEGMALVKVICDAFGVESERVVGLKLEMNFDGMAASLEVVKMTTTARANEALQRAGITV